MDFTHGFTYPFGIEVKVSRDSELLKDTGLSVGDVGRFCLATEQGIGSIWQTDASFLFFVNDDRCFILWDEERPYTREFQFGVDGVYFEQVGQSVSRRICDVYGASNIPLSRCCWLPSQLIEPTWYPNIGDKASYGGDAVDIVGIKNGLVNPQDVSEMGGIFIHHSSGIFMADAWKVRPLGDAACRHEFVNVGFTSIKMVCKKCDMEKE
jgi:hypothetical protein